MVTVPRQLIPLPRDSAEALIHLAYYCYTFTTSEHINTGKLTLKSEMSIGVNHNPIRGMANRLWLNTLLEKTTDVRQQVFFDSVGNYMSFGPS